VAIASTTPPRDILCSGDFGDNALDRERVAAALLPASPRLRVTSVYAPHGRHVEHWHYHYKLAFFDALTNCVSDWLRDDGHLVGGW
jgi:exonuclease III